MHYYLLICTLVDVNCICYSSSYTHTVIPTQRFVDTKWNQNLPSQHNKALQWAVASLLLTPIKLLIEAADTGNCLSFLLINHMWTRKILGLWPLEKGKGSSGQPKGYCEVVQGEN